MDITTISKGMAGCLTAPPLGASLRRVGLHGRSSALMRPGFVQNICRLVAASLGVLALLSAGPALSAPAPAVSASAVRATAAPAPEYQLKSAFLYNFITFIDWPKSVGDTLSLCVAVPHDALKYFSSLERRAVGGMKIAFRSLEEGDSAEGCRVLFVADSRADSFDDWLSEVGDAQVLTVAESAEWLNKGVVLDMLLQDERVVFDVNVEAAKGEGIVINSRLLRLARKVYGLESADESAEKTK